MESCYPLQLSIPFGAILAGQPEVGKSTFIKEFLINLSDILAPGYSFSRIVYCYSVYQPMYDEIKKAQPIVEFQEGFPHNLYEEMTENSKYGELNAETLIILDDLMLDVSKEPRLAKLFTTGRHLNCSVMLVLHNLFHDSPVVREAVRAANVYILFEMSNDEIVKNLGRKKFGDRKDFIYQSYRMELQEDPHGHLFIQTKVDVPEVMRVLGNVFDPNNTRCYVAPKKKML